MVEAKNSLTHLLQAQHTSSRVTTVHRFGHWRQHVKTDNKVRRTTMMYCLVRDLEAAEADERHAHVACARTRVLKRQRQRLCTPRRIRQHGGPVIQALFLGLRVH